MRTEGDIADWWKAGTLGGKLRKLELKQRETTSQQNVTEKKSESSKEGKNDKTLGKE